jgi:hypothetical protein
VLSVITSCNLKQDGDVTDYGPYIEDLPPPPGILMCVAFSFLFFMSSPLIPAPPKKYLDVRMFFSFGIGELMHADILTHKPAHKHLVHTSLRVDTLKALLQLEMGTVI